MGFKNGIPSFNFLLAYLCVKRQSPNYEISIKLTYISSLNLLSFCKYFYISSWLNLTFVKDEVLDYVQFLKLCEIKNFEWKLYGKVEIFLEL